MEPPRPGMAYFLARFPCLQPAKFGSFVSLKVTWHRLLVWEPCQLPAFIDCLVIVYDKQNNKRDIIQAFIRVVAANFGSVRVSCSLLPVYS